MKKVMFFLIFFFVPSLVLAADCTLDQYVTGDAAFKQTCTSLNINTTTNIGNLGSDALTFTDIYINDVVIEDLTFLNNVTTSRFIIMNSKVNLDNLRLKARIVFFRSTYIMDEDLSGLANNTILENLTFDNCWLNTLETIEELKGITTFTDLTITANRYLHLNLDPIMKLPNITNLGLSYMQQNISSNLSNYITQNNITVDTVSANSADLKSLVAYFKDELLPEYEDLSEIEQIRKATIYMADRFSITTESRTGAKSFYEALSTNEANIIEFSLIYNYLLQELDFKTAHILGHKSGAEASSSIYTLIYFNNKWNVIDLTAIEEDSSALSALKNGQDTAQFMQDVSVTFSGGAAMDEKLIDYMDYSYYIGYIMEDGNLHIQILPLDVSSYGLIGVGSDFFTFHGWYKDQEFTKPFTEDTPINKNWVLYGKFDMHGKPVAPLPPDPPNTGMFMGLWILLPIITLVGIEWYRNKSFKKIGL